MEQSNKIIDSSQFSPADWKRLTDYVATLITIDQKNRKKASNNNNINNNTKKVEQ